MKLVAAKCPSCGADIDVDKDSDSTKCEFCKTKILVEDAIAKYKVEISGKVEVDNLPKINNLMKLGDRYFNDKDYNEAYKQYEKLVELDPDNPKAVFRKGLTKSYNSGYTNFDIQSTTNGMKNAYKLLEKEKADNKTFNSYIVECYTLINTKIDQVTDYYKTNNLNFTGVNLIVTRLAMCLGELQYLNSIVKDNKQLKVNILNSIINLLNFMLGKLFYVNGVNANGIPNKQIFNPENKSSYQVALDAAVKERNELDPDAAKAYEKEQEIKAKQKTTMTILWTVFGVFCGLLFIIFSAAVISSDSSKKPFEKKWISDEVTIDFYGVSGRYVEITWKEQSPEKYKYEATCQKDTATCDIVIKKFNDETVYTLYFKDATEANDNQQSLCLKEGEECKIFLSAEGE